MNRDEALKLLRGGLKGVEEWNRWKAEAHAGGDELPDLSSADFSSADFSSADFSGTDLRGVNLFGANLTGANLTVANLTVADLFGADLSGADLSGANLSGANLADANLSRANLSRANLSFAWVRGTNCDAAEFTSAILRFTIFADVDLSSALGLDKVRHRGPCSIGVDTLFQSRCKIPESFLRGAGVPDGLIAYLPSLLGAMQPIEFYSCFISHSHKDEEFAQRLSSRLRDDKLRVWFAPEDLRGGKKLHDQIDEAIRLHDKLLLVLSEQSMASDWVATEIRKARRRERAEGRPVLFPIRLVSFERLRDWTLFDADTGTDLAQEIREYYIPDFSNWKNHDDFEAGYHRLLDDLKAEKRSPAEA